MKRPRLRKWAKRVCTLAAVLAVSAAVGSRFWALIVFVVARDQSSGLWIVVSQDLAACGVAHGSGPGSVRVPSSWHVERTEDMYWKLGGEGSPWGRAWSWRGGLLYESHPGGWDVGISLKYPVLLTAIPAALLWYADRRRFGPGLCTECGYDRRGIAEGANCPECGAPTPPQVSSRLRESST